MSRIKRWFPVSHDINHDPEVWELTDTFGDWLLYAWLDILSVTDRSEGEYNGSPRAIAVTLSRLCRGLRHDKDVVRRRFKGTDAAFRAELALYWMTLRRWLLPIVLTDKGPTVLEWWPNHARMVAEWCPNGHRIVGEWWPNGAPIIGFKTRNHLKYHKPRESIQVPSEPSEPSEPSLPKQKKKIAAAKAAVDLDFNFNKFWGLYPRKVGKAKAWQEWCREAKYCSDVAEAIFAALAWQSKQAQWLKDNGQFIPHAATWLHQRRWEDARTATAPPPPRQSATPVSEVVPTKPKLTPEEIAKSHEFLRSTIHSLSHKMGA